MASISDAAWDGMVQDLLDAKLLNEDLLEALEKIAVLDVSECAHTPINGEYHYWVMTTLRGIVNIANDAISKARGEKA